jgi:hypothetical protein
LICPQFRHPSPNPHRAPADHTAIGKRGSPQPYRVHGALRRHAGAREGGAHRTYDGEIDWFALRDGQYEKQAPDAAGVYHSETFPGLWLNEQAMIDGMLPGVMATLQQGLAGADHAEFVKRLSAAFSSTTKSGAGE